MQLRALMMLASHGHRCLIAVLLLGINQNGSPQLLHVADFVVACVTV